MTSISTDDSNEGRNVRLNTGDSSILNLSQPKGWKDCLKTLIPSLKVNKLNDIAAIGIRAMEDFE